MSELTALLAEKQKLTDRLKELETVGEGFARNYSISARKTILKKLSGKTGMLIGSACACISKKRSSR